MGRKLNGGQTSPERPAKHYSLAIFKLAFAAATVLATLAVATTPDLPKGYHCNNTASNPLCCPESLMITPRIKAAFNCLPYYKIPFKSCNFGSDEVLCCKDFHGENGLIGYPCVDAIPDDSA
ncbi:hypothetical protein BDP27DRAFT_1415481 [Rhodocollybia butyracea]|uniref:Hydrophobin n=1 Tax=Rhodocollybia butyracea TaxID=206335 RepID=A0A9P5UDF7_9AGAR|nr:hypothetical protein BDP27DRAFT_1415481 [Rhodocollybia butyracea]